MVYDVIMSICMNISLLIVLALMLTKIEFVKVLLLNGEEEERNDRKTGTRKVRNQLVLGGIFGIFCVISDYIGIQVEGALPNARVIGVLSAGFLGGPVSGMTTAVIASIHRYLIFPERISTLACVLAAILHGVIGSWIGYAKKDNRQYSNWFLLVSTFVAEAIHMILILILTRPFNEALVIVKIVLVPMVIINSVGMVIFFSVFKSNVILLYLMDIPCNFEGHLLHLLRKLLHRQSLLIKPVSIAHNPLDFFCVLMHQVNFILKPRCHKKQSLVPVLMLRILKENAVLLFSNQRNGRKQRTHSRYHQQIFDDGQFRQHSLL